MAKNDELEDLPKGKEPLTSGDLEGVVGGLPAGGGTTETKQHGSTGSEEEMED